MKVLVTGADGQVGTEMVRLTDDGFQVVGLNRRDLDITDRDAIARCLDAHEPDLLVNCAAYTAVDQAEDEPDLAYRVNADAVGWLGQACDPRGVAVIHFSTDYVFDGTKDGPYTEDDSPNPLNVYGASKLAGENRLREATDRHLILRVSWVFGRIGRSFVDTILRLARERDELTVVDDQVGTPTPARTIASMVGSTVGVLSRGQDEWGTHHLSTKPITSWCGFARTIVAMAAREGLLASAPSIAAIRSSQWPVRATRPMNSAMDSSKLNAMLDVQCPAWEPDLAGYIKECLTGQDASSSSSASESTSMRETKQ